MGKLEFLDEHLATSINWGYVSANEKFMDDLMKQDMKSVHDAMKFY